jgi:hypothetical protein
MSGPALAPTHRFWPVGEAAQADYETLRARVLTGEGLLDELATADLGAARFARRGLAGLIAWPSAEPVFAATLRGATRPPWTPDTDPRLDALAAGFALLLGQPPTATSSTTGFTTGPSRESG